MDCLPRAMSPKIFEDFQPLRYQHLQKAQLADTTMLKLLKDDNTKECQKECCGGGKATSLITYKHKIVIPARLQKHVIMMWYHTMLCHPGINRNKETIGQHLWWPKMRPFHKLRQNMPFLS